MAGVGEKSFDEAVMMDPKYSPAYYFGLAVQKALDLIFRSNVC